MDDDALCDHLALTTLESWTLAPEDMVAGLAQQTLKGRAWRLVAHVPDLRWAFASPDGGVIVADGPELHRAELLHHLPHLYSPSPSPSPTRSLPCRS